MRIIITGCAGFIGFHLTKFLNKNQKNKILGIDNLNNFYPNAIKKDRLSILKKNKNFLFRKINICKYKDILKISKKFSPDIIINLAAVAGVRHSLKNPRAYINNNILGFFNILEVARKTKVNNVFFASSSSVYGDNKSYPFSEKHNINSPISVYAATKASNELLAHSYSHLYKINMIGMRFFTVYGPWGRPDMALFKFVKLAIKKKKLPIFNNGNMIRNFTYIDDVIISIYKLINKTLNKKNSKEYFDIYNIGNYKTFPLITLLDEIKNQLNINLKFDLKEMQLGDIFKSESDQSKLFKKINFRPKTTLKEGIKKFLQWYLNYFKIKNLFDVK